MDMDVDIDIDIDAAMRHAGNGSVADTHKMYSEDGDVAAAARALQDLESREPQPVAANGRRGAKVDIWTATWMVQLIVLSAPAVVCGLTDKQHVHCSDSTLAHDFDARCTWHPSA